MFYLLDPKRKKQALSFAKRSSALACSVNSFPVQVSPPPSPASRVLLPFAYAAITSNTAITLQNTLMI